VTKIAGLTGLLLGIGLILYLLGRRGQRQEFGEASSGEARVAPRA
jgi:hypothetical protein